MADSVYIDIRPLRTWPKRATEPDDRKGPRSFKVTAGQVLRELEQEVGRVKGTDAYLEVDVSSPKDIRADGRLRADARVVRPGVVLYFTHPVGGDLRFACDSYQEWHHNVRGIQLTLERLRDIDRYGAVQDAEQFRGFRALTSVTGLTMGTTAALNIFEECSGMRAEPRTPQRFAEMYRVARASTHPDRQDGNRVMWDKVESAAKVLGVARG